MLDTYAKPLDPKRPVVCVDAGGKQLIGDARGPLPARVGSPAEQDREYARGGMADLFVAVEPPAGRRHVRATGRKAGVDFARFLRVLSDDHDPDADRIVLVCDNLSTHTPAALYEAFDAAEARRVAERFEWHDTPGHGSWLNIAECELGVLARQCLDRRIPDRATLTREVASSERDRNAAEVTINWPSTTADARVKLKRLSPRTQVQ